MGLQGAAGKDTKGQALGGEGLARLDSVHSRGKGTTKKTGGEVAGLRDAKRDGGRA